MSVCQFKKQIQVQVFRKVSELQNFLQAQIQDSRSIGFIPTMGALHAGHGSLVSKARMENDIVVASIFVNPTQFNNPSDLEKYPRTIEKDVQLLAKLNCDAVLIPDVEQIYTKNFVMPPIDLGNLDQVMEGAFRPGHFMGVVSVVYRFFQIVDPDRAYFGLKDYQQVAVIRLMVQKLHLRQIIVACPTLREESGLAMSSRNARLTSSEKQDAVHISQTLFYAAEQSKIHSPVETKALTLAFFEKGNLRLEYLEFVHPVTLEPLRDKWVPESIACIVAYAGEVRLIDNIQLN